MRKAKCKVVFEEDARGVDALLKSGPRVLNIMRMGKAPTAAAKRRARTRLMRGCTEMLQHARRRGK